MIFISLSLVQLHGKEIESLGIVFSLKAVGEKKVTRKERGKNERERNYSFMGPGKYPTGNQGRLFLRRFDG